MKAETSEERAERAKVASERLRKVLMSEFAYDRQLMAYAADVSEASLRAFLDGKRAPRSGTMYQLETLVKGCPCGYLEGFDGGTQPSRNWSLSGPTFPCSPYDKYLSALHDLMTSLKWLRLNQAATQAGTTVRDEDPEFLRELVEKTFGGEG